jgi:NAD(P)-dependent dehydrogenase (short-subunit alcohol dehydrogenase family)
MQASTAATRSCAQGDQPTILHALSRQSPPVTSEPRESLGFSAGIDLEAAARHPFDGALVLWLHGGAVADWGYAMAGRLEGHHVLVTGGGRGIGAAIVERALEEGARVSFIDVEKEESRALVERLAAGERLCFAIADVRSTEQINSAHASVVGKLGPVTGLVNNAGRNSYADPVAMTETQWDDVFSVDLKSAWLVARAVLPAMIAARRGSIVNIASLHADMTYPGMFPYAAAKSGLVGFTRSLALEVGPHQVRVNALSPGYTETGLVKEFFALNDPALRRAVLEAHPMRRMAEPREIANCAVFLLSDEASFVTGANWRADGGLGARFAG